MKTIFYFIGGLLFISINGVGQPPNNSIFFGSAGDGISQNSNGLLSNNLFYGGAGDGMGTGENGISFNNIFVGGNGDGFSYQTNAAAAHNIFLGGDGDGFSYHTNAATANNIFLGGDGDGWYSIYRPLGPLPVLYNYFLASKLNDRTALLKWETEQEFNNAYFEVERSVDGLYYYKLANVSAAGNSQIPIAYSFIDYEPKVGKNFYRIKQVDVNGSFTYTESRLLHFNADGAGTIKYYPNPTQGKLTIEFPQEIYIQTKSIKLFSASGALIKQMSVAANSDKYLPLDLSKYNKGVYFIQIKTSTNLSTLRIILE